MDFVHRPFEPKKTIAAISTPLGEGGISIVRLSGTLAIEIADRLFSRPVKSFLSHTAHFGIIKDLTGRKLDEAILLVMKAPKSYTGEDTVEFQCHGGVIASKKVLEAAVSAGAHLASPGEFTYRAFLNGKIDLTQAEAVQKLISAKNEYAYEMARHHLEGGFGKRVKELYCRLISIAAVLEAWVDFPDEGLEFANKKEIIQELIEISSGLEKMIQTFEEGQKMELGISLCLIGPPNSGKSSLLNALLEKERAIVTPLAGTTRDLLHEDFQMGGLHFKLTDTAGIRETDEVIEKEGIRRSKEAFARSDIVLLVLDVQEPPDLMLYEALPKEKTLIVWNKIDLNENFSHSIHPYEVKISVKEKRGLGTLKEKIHSLIWEGKVPSKEEIIISSLRHKDALTQALCYLKKIIAGFSADLSPEFLTADVRSSLTELGAIIGSNITEEILSSIFSQFCIGK